MTIFRVGFFPRFLLDGDDAVLAAADEGGLRTFQSAVRSAHEDGEGAFELHGVKHRVIRQAGVADIEGLRSQTVVWRFDDTQLVEILDMTEPLISADDARHDYFDELNSPDATLMLSVGEYVDGGPFAEFPRGLPVPTFAGPQKSTVSSDKSAPAQLRNSADHGGAAAD
jgi:hypothetical protein